MFDVQKKFSEYINNLKRVTYIFSIITILMFLIVLYISIMFDNYILFILEVGLFIISVNKIRNYSKIKKIEKYLIKYNLIDKIGNINFINKDDCVFADYYMITLYKKNILCFNYLEIKRVYKEYWNKFYIDTAHPGNHIELYLHFILKNGVEFRILTDKFSYILLNTDENYKNIIKYLLEKNNGIEIGEEILKNKLCMK